MPSIPVSCPPHPKAIPWMWVTRWGWGLCREKKEWWLRLPKRELFFDWGLMASILNRRGVFRATCLSFPANAVMSCPLNGPATGLLSISIFSLVDIHLVLGEKEKKTTYQHAITFYENACILGTSQAHERQSENPFQVGIKLQCRLSSSQGFHPKSVLTRQRDPLSLILFLHIPRDCGKLRESSPLLTPEQTLLECFIYRRGNLGSEFHTHLKCT